MDRFTELQTFVTAADRESFSAAADSLGLSRALVSKHIAGLEQRLGVRLFNRTTRRVVLTEAGRAFAVRARNILDELALAEGESARTQTEARGLLRVNAPVGFGWMHLAPLLPKFMAQHPGLRVDLTLNDRLVDIVEEGYDVALRIGKLTDSSLVAKKLARSDTVLAASPAYLKTHGTPKHPSELSNQACLGYHYWALRDRWPFTGPDGREITVKVSGPLDANNGDALCELAVRGLGFILHPAFYMADHLRRGRLVPVLQDWKTLELGIYAIYPPGRALPAKTRVFIDMLSKAWGDNPPWNDWKPSPKKQNGRGVTRP